jgi:nitrite reductase (NO-forming)
MKPSALVFTTQKASFMPATTGDLLPIRTIRGRCNESARWPTAIRHLLLGVGAALLPVALPATAVAATPPLERISETLVPPPNLPAHEQADQHPPRIVQVTLTVREKQIQVAPGAMIWALTYDGSVPAPIIVVHQNDYLELTLINPATNSLTHNIDFHAATGALGGAELTYVAPGQEAVLRFKCIKTGVFVYHCAPGGAMIPLHVASGMNGVLMVLPREGLTDRQGRPLHYDKAYYVGEQDFYLAQDKDGNYKSYAAAGGNFGDMLGLMKTLTPTFEVFEGSVGALEGEHALTANVGENVLFIHSQADLDTRIHLIGGHADYVWMGGSFANPPQRDYQTWFVPAGSAVAAMYRFRQPGTYAYLNHQLAEAVLLGAEAQVKVSGQWDDDLMTQVQKPGPIPNPKR